MISALANITWKQWRLRRLRTLLTLLGITLGVAVFFAVRTANVSLINSLTTTIEKVAGKATLQIVGGESGFPESVWEIVKDTPGVKIAEPTIEVVAHTAFEDEGALLIVGADMLGDGELREYQFDEGGEIGDPLVALAQPDSILVSRVFADKHKLKEGDKLPLFTSQGKKDFTVRGVFNPSGLGEVFGGQIAVMDVFNAQFVFGRGKNFDRIDLMNDPETTVEELRGRLRERLPAGLEIERPSSRGQELESAVKGMNIGMTVTSLIALLVGMFIIFNTFSISVNQRWKEIGALRAIGVERKNIQRMFLGEAAVMGLIGSALGVALGFGLSVVVEMVMSSIAGRLFGLVSTRQAPVFRLDFALLSFALGVAASIVAAWAPSRAASQLDPAMALHNIEARQRESVLGPGRLIAGVAMVSAGLALIRFAPLRAGLYIQFSYVVLIILGMVAALPKLSELTARALRPLMDRLFGAEGALAVDSMIQAPRRTSATVGALMIGLMFVFATGAYVQSQKDVFERWMENAINADLVVNTNEGARSRTWHFDEALAGRIAEMPGVTRLENVRFIFLPYADDSVALIALDLDGWFARSRLEIQGADAASAREKATKGEGVLVSGNFANRYGLWTGDRVRLRTPTEDFDRPIAGVIEDYTSEKGSIFVDRALYKRYWKDSSIDIINVNLAPGVDRVAFKNELQRALKGQQRAFIYTQEEWRSWVLRLLDQFFAMMYMQMLVAVFTAALGIVNALIISTAERKRELGVIRAIGGLRGQLRKMILLEAVVIAVIGIVTAAIAGVFSAYFLTRTAAAMIGGYTIPFVFPVRIILFASPIVLVIALLAAWWPARRAVNLRVVEAIGYE
ncbi:MAG TPA: FtsX-like permease family protein [Blastocatellia bacterium]|nr:FtsX-like permease family protein [Blastocatellia bacterium]